QEHSSRKGRRMWTTNARRIGMLSGTAIFLLSLVYVATGIAWVVGDAGRARIGRLEPTEPFLTVLESIIILIAPALVRLCGAIQAYAAPEKKTSGLAAFGFALLTAGLTGAVHFVQVTAVRAGTRTSMEAFALYDPDGRLTPVLATDLLAWDFFLGFGLLV